MLLRWSQGDRDALNTLLPLVYDELRRMAHRHMRGERPEHTLHPTGLVHEAYLRLSRQSGIERPLRSRGHFFALASTLMRHILVDHARAQQARKRGAEMTVGPLKEDLMLAPGHTATQVLALDEALHQLDRVDPDLREVVECRCFGGLSIQETAQALSTSVSSVKRDWAAARAWLLREMRHQQWRHTLWHAATVEVQ